MTSTYGTRGRGGPLGPMGVEYKGELQSQAEGSGECMGPKTNKKQEAPEQRSKQIRRMPPIFNAPNPVAIRNGGGGRDVSNKCTTIGRPQHMNRCRAGAKDAGVMVACRNVAMSSGLLTSCGRDGGAGPTSVAPLDEAPGGGRLSPAAPSAPESSSKTPR